MTRNPAKPPVSGPAMLQTNVPPRSLTANPKSEAEGIVVPRIGFPIRPAPTTDASRSSSSAFAAHTAVATSSVANANTARSEEHTSELQSRLHLVCRLLLEKKKTKKTKRQ